MLTLSRRSFIAAGGVGLPFWLWFKRYAAAETGPVVRYDVLSPDGAKMLATYEKAVKQMGNTSAGDPRSWLFQWYTHCVKRTATKQSELARIYPASGDPQRALADTMWNTCQAHFQPQYEKFFLPWHRMYVFFLERMIRQVSGEPTFTLPYWNYSTAEPGAHGVLPSQFRLSTSPLFRRDRNADANKGLPIDSRDPGALNLDSLREPRYEPQGAAPGFCMALDRGLHGSVHVLVGNRVGMGDVPWAANDPIFWLHHCNIDRLWASWNRAGGSNPTDQVWLLQKYAFADERGNRVDPVVKDFVETEKLGYTYDRFEAAPADLAALRAAPVPRQTRMLALKAGGEVALGAGPVRVTLEPPPGPNEKRLPFAAQVASLGPGQRLFLLLKKLRAAAQPGVLYHVYLNLPSAVPPVVTHPNHVGAFSFFDSTEHGDHGSLEGQEAWPFVAFDVTAVVSRLREEAPHDAAPSVTIAAPSQPAAEAHPVVGELALAAQ